MDKKEKALGQVKEITIDITMPVPMKFNRVSFQQLTIMTGQNGSGKSLIMACTFCMAYILSILVLRILGQKELEDLSKIVFDKSFNNQDFNGTMHFEYDSGAWLKIEFDNGVVKSADYHMPEDIKHPTMVTYMSSQMRTFNDIKMYMTARKFLVKSNPELKHDEIVMEITNDFKLFDSIYVEKLLLNCPIKLSADLTKTLCESYDFDDEIDTIDYDPNVTDFYYTRKEDPTFKKYLTTLSKGQQSILNMFIGSSI